MQLKNNPELQIYNGDIGEIIETYTGGNEEHEIMKILFGTRKVTLKEKDLENLTHAYAISIHKAQGSEFKVVVLPLVDSSRRMLNKKLLYTALTRAKEKLIIIGNLDLIEYATHNPTPPRRTILKELLIDNIKML